MNAHPATRYKPLFKALAASLCLHLMLLGEQTGNDNNDVDHTLIIERNSVAQGLHARLRPGVKSPPPTTMASTTNTDTAQPAGSSKNRPYQDNHLPAAPAITRPETAPVAPVKSPLSPTPSPTSAPDTSPATAIATAAPTASGNSHHADGKRRYLISLATAARQFRDYPRDTLAEGGQGVATVRLDITAGQVPTTSLAQSSGDPRLDAAALDMITRASSIVSLPDSLRNQTFSLWAPIEFRADNE